MKHQFKTTIFLLTTLLTATTASGQTEIPIAKGWARTKVNTTIFRHNALSSLGDHQVAAFYNADSHVVLAERRMPSREWRIHVTELTGRTADAHNGISTAFDGNGILHLAWNHHSNPLQYCTTVSGNSMELTALLPMTGQHEDQVTYPEFYRLPDGDLLFFYRDGASGNGNLVLNRFLIKERRWVRIQDNLLDGENTRNAYWQVAIDRHAAIHLSWVWRETGDVVTNHDIGYAVSKDGGKTWQKTTGEKYSVPIAMDEAEYAVRIPQNSELANQTSMAVDDKGHPVIANFWRAAPDAVPQYHLLMHDGTRWIDRQIGERTLNFFRKGGGTKKPPISRPLVLLETMAEGTRTHVLFRDRERGGHITVASSSNLHSDDWTYTNLTSSPVGQSDPMIDPDIWASQSRIHLLTQFAGQGDGEKQEDVSPQMVSVVEWSPAEK